jgi:Zn-dependent peptidase ImmA (M78 family)/transcriptional regulator with XRE-family HTH domain
LVNPPLLVWAREEAGYSLEGAAERSGLSVEKLRAWETGQAQPTLRQAERLAAVYERPFSLFSLPAPPALAPQAAGYRKLPGVRPGAEPPALRLAVRRLVQRRRLALHLYAELGDEPPDYPLRARLAEDPEAVGGRLREALEVPVAVQLEWPSEFAAFRAWRAAVERLGVLVCQMPGRDLGQVRGTSIVHFPLPVVGISSTELPLSKPFTLFHEVVHLALAACSEERPAREETRDEPGWMEVERFCEAAAGAALMPADAITADADVAAQRRSGAWEVEAVRRSARRFRVTPTALTTRLWRLGHMSNSAYARWKEAWQRHREGHTEKPAFGIATPAEKAVSRNGPLFTSLVLGALSGDRITSADACEYLDLGFGHVETLRRGWIEQPAGLAVTGAE